MLKNILQKIKKVFRVEGASIALHDAAHKEFYFIRTVEEQKNKTHKKMDSMRFPDHFGAAGWVMRENSYLAQVVKIDTQRDHQVVTTGPYALVRHPMYTVVIILLFAVPVALGSRYALLLSVFLTVLLIVRTYLEDRTLHAELEGYPEYSNITRYRLAPGIW